MRSGSVKNLFIIIFILLILGFAAFGFYYAYRNIATIKMLPWLAEEIGSKPVLTMATLNIEPGQVYIVSGDIQGWQVKQKDSKLYEYLILTTDISVNDVISWHGYDAYVAPSDTPTNYIYLGDVTPYNGSYTMIMYAKGYPTDSKTIQHYNPINTGYFIISLDDNGYLSSTGRDPFTNDVFSHPYSSSSDVEFALMYDYNTNTSYYIDTDEITTGSTIKHGFGYRIQLGKDVDWDTPLDRDRNQDPSRWGYFILYRNLINAEEVQRIINEHIVIYSNYWRFFDATWYNGTHFLDIKDGASFQILGTVTRLPAEQTWLWIVKSLKSDNKLHFMWFPKGSIISIKDQYGNVLKKFEIDGTPINNDNQIEDYTIDLNTDVIPQATIEAYVPSMKVRVYGPLGATVEVQDQSGVVVGSGRISGDYVDIVLTKKITNGKIIVYADKESSKQLDIRADFNNDKLTVKIYDNNVPVPDLLVRIADASGVVVAAGTTNQSGAVEFKVDRPLVEATIEVSGIWKNELIYLTETAASPPPNNQVVNDTSAERTRLLLLGLGLMLLVGVVYVVARNRVRIT